MTRPLEREDVPAWEAGLPLVWRLTAPSGEPVEAQTVAVAGGASGRAVLRDLSGRLWLADLAPAEGEPALVAGPVSIDQAVAAAVAACAGRERHCSAGELHVMLTVGLVGLAVEAIQGNAGRGGRA